MLGLGLSLTDVAVLRRGGGTAGLVPLATGARAVAFGDSITQQHSTGFTSGNALAGKSNLGAACSEIGWAIALDPRFRYDNWPDINVTDGTTGFIRYTNGGNQAVSGENTTQILGRVQAFIAANRTWDFAILNGPGINDINGTFNIPIATTKANIQAMVDAIIAAGKSIILAPPRPCLRAAYVVDTAAIWTWMQTTFGAGTAHASKVILVDYQAPMRADGPVANDFRDSDLHPGSWAAQANALGRDLSMPSSSLLGALRRLVASGNMATADYFQRTNLGSTNPNFTGSGGAVAGAVTGVAPTGWSCIRSTGTAATAVASLAANADTGGQSVILTITPGGTANNEQFRLQMSSGLSGAAATALQSLWMRLIVEVETDGNPTFGEIYAELNCSDANCVGRALGNGPSTTNFTSYQPRGGLRYFLMSEPILMPATLTSVQTAIYIGMLNTLGTTPGVVKIHRTRLINYGDPRPGYGF